MPLYKKGDMNNVEQYRGIAQQNSLNKVYASALCNRLTKWVEDNKILHENQAWFRSGYSTFDIIFNLNFLVKYLWFKGRKEVFCFFV